MVQRGRPLALGWYAFLAWNVGLFHALAAFDRPVPARRLAVAVSLLLATSFLVQIVLVMRTHAASFEFLQIELATVVHLSVNAWAQQSKPVFIRTVICPSVATQCSCLNRSSTAPPHSEAQPRHLSAIGWSALLGA